MQKISDVLKSKTISDGKNVVSEMKEELLKSEFKNVVENITAIDIPQLYKFYIKKNACNECKGLFDCKYDVPGVKPYITKANTISHVECKYAVSDNKQANRNKLLDTLEIPDSFLGARLSEFFLTNDERTQLHADAIELINDYKDGKDIKGMYIEGTYGTGKTYLLAAIANGFVSYDKSAYIVYFPDLVRTFSSSMKEPDLLEKRLRYLKQVDVLFLDDVGAEHMSAWFRDNIFGPLLQYRMGDKKPTFYSTNLPLEAIKEHYNNSSNKLDETKGMRILDRIRRTTDYYKLSERIK